MDATSKPGADAPEGAEPQGGGGPQHTRRSQDAQRPQLPESPQPSKSTRQSQDQDTRRSQDAQQSADTQQSKETQRSQRARRRGGRGRRGPKADPAGRGGRRGAPDSGGQAERRAAARRAVRPRLEYPPELPVSAEREEIAAAIRDNQVVIVAGETGSGKTTQLPKICMELGYGIEGMIGHTQPRRIAARAVASRLAEETRLELGHGIGYQVRFTSEVDDSTRVKVMTDGILLAELRHDPQLRAYDVIIIDEAHERSLNIDFLLGFLARLLPQRPDLKVIITSATIDPESFAAHFDNAPIIRVSGRTYPVELRYRPVGQEAADTAAGRAGEDDEEPAQDEPVVPDAADQLEGIIAAFDELRGEAPGDILVFLSGEREIRDAAEALEAHLQRGSAAARQWEIVPLFGRLSAGDQQRVFAPHSRPRVVLATNVAETSLTVPGIVYVIDAGTARISRYSNRTKVQRLPIEPISQASARQRAGRSGRTSPGIAIRLYSEADFAARPEYTDPEILRTNLASVILQMVSLGFARTEAEIASFPFLTPPEPKAVRDGRALLAELGALTVDGGRLALTQLGRTLARVPVDPRLARMILAGAQLDCAGEVTAIVAALSIQDPRERPAEHRGEADALHARFADARSDFLSYLHLWDWIQDQSARLSSSKFRRKCRAEYLNYVRIREWQDLVGQLRSMLGSAGVHVPRPPRLESNPALADADEAPGGAKPAGTTPADGKDKRREAPRMERGKPAKRPYSQREADIHKSLITGLLSMFGVKVPEGRGDYQGARGTRMRIFPGSTLFKQGPDVIVAAELVETSRLWARTCAEVDPEWIVQAAGPLAKHQYGEPHWSMKTGSAMAYDRVSLYGVPLIGDRRVGYGAINPVEARELFIRHALIAGEWSAHHAFLQHNARALREAEELASRVRSRRLLAGDDVLFDFYDARLPETVVSAAHFESWWKTAQREDPGLLDISAESLLADDSEVGEDVAADYPLQWELPGGASAKLRYAFEPGSSADGVTVELSEQAALGADPDLFTWQVPGLREELITALIRSLPKGKRRYFVPAPDVARAIRGELTPYEGALPRALADALSARAGGGELHDLVPITIAPEDFDLSRLPAHLRLSFAIVAGSGRRRRVLARGEDLRALQAQLRAAEGARPGQGRRSDSPAGQDSDAPGGQPPGARGRGGASGTGRGAAHGEAPTVEPRTGLTDWSFGPLPEPVSGGGRTLWPGLRDDGSAVSLRGFDTAGEAARSTRAGTARLLALGSGEALSYAVDQLSTNERLLLAGHRTADADPLADALVGAVLRAMDTAGAVSDPAGEGTAALGGLPRTAEDFAALRRRVNDTILADLAAVLATLQRAFAGADAAQRLVSKSSALTVLANLSDVSTQLERLLQPHLAADTAPRWLARVPVYAAAAQHRVESMGGQAARDRQLMDRVQCTAAEVEAKAARALGPGAEELIRRRSILLPEAWQDVLFDVEELRVSLFAPQLGTAHTVSEKRIAKALAKL